MTDEMKAALQRTFDRLNAMSNEELRAELEKHKNGDIAQTLLESGFAEVHRPKLESKFTEVHEPKKC